MSAEGWREPEGLWEELAAVRAAMARLIEARRARSLSPPEEARYRALGQREAELLLRLR